MNNDFEQQVLAEMLECSSCTDIEKTCAEKLESMDIDEMIANLPALPYVLDRMLDYIFSNGLTTGDETKDDVLDEWLYEEKNATGATNYLVLRDAIGEAITKGECGLRMYNGALYTVKKGHYALLVSKHDGIEEVVAYFMKEDGGLIDNDTVKWDELETYGDVMSFFDDKGLILLDDGDFVNLRNDTSELHGHSPFLLDKQRTALLLSTYERLNYDINYDGPGRIIIRPNDGFKSGEDNDVSTGALVDNSGAAMARRAEDAKKEARRVANEIKNSSSDAVVLLSKAFGDKVEHLPRVTKATEFFGWLEQESVIVAEVLGMSPTLLELGRIHGNVSVEAIIDNAMLNTIIPRRESYATQFSWMISRYLGLPKVYFDKYDLQQVDDENENRKKMSEVIRNLALANKSFESAEVTRLIDEFSQMLRTSLYDGGGNLRTL